ncbi:glycerophosphodiester phosphodiesterase [Brevibacillus fluminis]|uniref:Glycerophosphodiester phosphodiesterase n=1 Tax=Brevibacillus fluminis TaxID=511487 RepID=A0A3M8DBJ7_9BACL|nr:glycerophosphodiester phosphodiesterase [Brevibacillus fluminis]RNB85001.1 glycerophosphodiester phosphodiesterase [Brevibacillus fluminis]
MPLIFAHRGSSGLYPENTMEAFTCALRHKADGIELDVQLTLDGEVVVIHDHRLERTTNGSGLVQQHTLAELRQLNAGRWFHPRFKTSRIPTLAEVFTFVKPTRLMVILELKNLLVPQPHLEEKVCQLIDEFELGERVILSSFNFNSLRKIKELNNSLQTGMLYVGHLLEPWKTGLTYGVDQLHAPVDEVSLSVVKESHKNGLSVLAWTVDQKKAVRRMLAMKVDGLITNYPEQARKLMQIQPT